MARRTQGTDIWVVDESTTTPGEFELVKIDCPLNFKPISVTAFYWQDKGGKEQVMICDVPLRGTSTTEVF